MKKTKTLSNIAKNIFVMILLVASFNSYSQFNPNNPAASGMVKTFDDEFNSLSASHSGSGVRWETNFYYNSLTQSNDASYLPLDPAVCNLGLTPFSINNGILTITAQNTAQSLQNCGVTQPYTAGGLNTYHSFSQTYGYWETRAKASNVYGTIFAFWGIPEDGSWPPEIDAPEILGRMSGTDFVTNHYTNSNGNQQIQCYPNVGDLSTAFHTYGMLWNPTNITWYLDGVQICQTPTQSDENKPFYLILDFGVGACGDGWADCPQNGGITNLNATVQVDYVHVWQYSNQNPALCIGDCSGTSATSVSASSSAICKGNSTTLTASGASTYVWSTAATTSSITVSPTITTTYLVTGTTNSVSTTATITVVVNPIPSTPTISKNNCNELVSSASGTSQWYLNGNIISGATTQNYFPTQNGNYTVQTNNGGCNSALSQGYNYTAIPFSDTASCASGIVIDGVLNEAAWNGTSQNICNALIGTGDNVTSSFKTRWDNTYLYVGVDVNDPILNNNSVNNWQNSSVELFLDMNNGKSTSYTAYDFHYIIGWNNPTLWETNNRTTGVNFKTANKTGGYQAEVAIPWTTLGVTPANGTIYGLDAAIDVSHTAGTRTSQIFWSGAVIGGAYPDANPSQWGILPLNGNCTATSVGQNSSLQNLFSIYPNPTSGETTLSYSLSETSDVKIAVYDILGKEVMKITDEKLTAGTHQLNFNTAGLQSGMYFIKGIIGGQVVTEKLLVNN